jgi:hypothetical protein
MSSHKHANGYNITPALLSQIYRDLSELFDGKVVIIGGRAVNIYCAKDKRNTDDLDVVVRIGSNLTTRDIQERLIEYNFSPAKESFNPENGFYQLQHRSGVKIDIYLLREGEQRESWPISGIPKIDIIDNAVERQLPTGDRVYIVDPVRLVLMKFNSHRPQDIEDIGNIISSLYSSFDDFLEEGGGIIYSYVKMGFGEFGKEYVDKKYSDVISLLEGIYNKKIHEDDTIFLKQARRIR